MKTLKLFGGILLVIIMLYSCYNNWSKYSFSRNIDTYKEWVEYHHSGVEYDEFIFSEDYEKIRKSFVEFMNKGYMESVHGGKIPNDPDELRIKEMVTTLDDGNTLLIYNLGNLMDTDQKEFTDRFFDKIIDYQIDSLNLDEVDSAVYGFIDRFFYKLIIHNEYHNGIKFTHTDRDELECGGYTFIDDIAKSFVRMDEIKKKAKALKKHRRNEY